MRLLIRRLTITTTSTPALTTTRRSARTDTFDDGTATVAAAKTAGLSPCSGAIVGLGESNEDIVDVALALLNSNQTRCR